MKSFIKLLMCFSIITIVVIGVLFWMVDAAGWSDWAYKRLRSSGEKSLIIGTSRAAQGIHPAVINKELKGAKFDLPIYNFSFTMTASPYGEVYYNSIVRKLTNKSFNDALFIMSADPWALSFEKGEDEEHLRELNACLFETPYYFIPNIFYLWKYGRPISFDKVMELQDDGWLKVNVPMDSVSLNARIENKKKEYKDVRIVKSEYRLLWFRKIIEMLKEHGTVVLCRIPASQYFFEMEDLFWPEFEADMQKVAVEEGVIYISFRNNFSKYRTTDGQHLYKDDGAKFSKALCDSIKTRINRNYN